LSSLQGHDEVVELLLAAGADPNLKGDYGRTALVVASLHSHAEVVESLLQYGADPSLKDESNKTALDWARRRKNWKIVRLLEGNNALVSDSYCNVL
jgi:ankyrin repeat protein